MEKCNKELTNMAKCSHNIKKLPHKAAIFLVTNAFPIGELLLVGVCVGVVLWFQ